jgi:hypothetical protein
MTAPPRRDRRARLAAVTAAVAVAILATTTSAFAQTAPSQTQLLGRTAPSCVTTACPDTMALTPAQQAILYGMAEGAWKFFAADTDPNTHLPMDSLSTGAAPTGDYTSPTDIGVNLWSIIAAHDLHLTSFQQMNGSLDQALTAIEGLEKWNGFLLSWYSTKTGQAINNPGPDQAPITTLDGQFISTVDNGWYGAALVEVRQADPVLSARATRLLDAMNFSQFYDAGNEATDPNAGQVYGGWTVGTGPATFEYGLLNTETRIIEYLGIGNHTLPVDTWWRTWRTEPAQYGQRQTPVGSTVTETDPLTGRTFAEFEGHYTYDGIDYVPSWGGTAFEALMPNLVVPETLDAPDGFGGNDQDYTRAMIAYDTGALGYKVWGLSPASTPDDTGDYLAYGSAALGTDASDTDYVTGAVAPHASFLALATLPQSAFRNIETMLGDFPQSYGPYGFYDSLNPTTGEVAHRYLVLDEGMLFTALDNALTGQTMQRRWANDPVGQVDIEYLRAETMSVAPFVPFSSFGGRHRR